MVTNGAGTIPTICIDPGTTTFPPTSSAGCKSVVGAPIMFTFMLVTVFVGDPPAALSKS
jgi:hypothetical protein